MRYINLRFTYLLTYLTDMGRKLGGSAPLGDGELGPHLTRGGQGRDLPACRVSS